MHNFFRDVKKATFFVALFALTLSACLPTEEKNISPARNAASAATPTAETETGLPPKIVETVPLNGSRIGLDEEIVFYFDQPMERASVESALSVDPVGAGDFVWVNDETIKFTPNEGLEAGASLNIAFETGAKSILGRALPESRRFSFQAAEALRPVQLIPEDGSANLGVDSAVAVGFNQPVVSLGAEAATLPAAFELEPTAQGHGEWLNTSTYVFYPDALEGGKAYQVYLNPDLQSLAGTSLSAETDWTFSTAEPRLLETEPSTEVPLPLDLAWTFRFNQPMDRASVESNFVLADLAGEKVTGSFAWADDSRSFVFTADELLARDRAYRLVLSRDILAQGGTPLAEALEAEVYSAPHFAVVATDPEQTGVLDEYLSGNITFSTAVGDKDIEDYLSIKPKVANFSANVYGNELYFQGDFEPETHYTLRISPDVQDLWGESLGKEFYYAFSTPKPEPSLTFPYLGTPFYFTSAENPVFYFQAVNVPSVSLTLGEVSPDDFFALFARDSYDFRENYEPENSISWREYLSNEENKAETFGVNVAPQGETLTPGFYSLLLWKTGKEGSESPNYLVASNVNLVFKFSATDALVWATDLKTDAFLVGQPVAIYAEDGTLLAEGITDERGLWRGAIPAREDPYQHLYAMLGKPGDKDFGFSASLWGEADLSAWSFNLREDLRPPHSEVYLYTDRPIYRPGQTVYFRAVLREAYDGRYSAPAEKSLPLTVADGYGENLASLNPLLSPYGTAHGSYTIPEDAAPGYYSFYNSELHFSAYFEVAEYRKPEIELSLALNAAEIKKDAMLQAEISARYYFGAAASDLPIRWTLYEESGNFLLPDYHVGELDLNWFDDEYPADYYGNLLAEGSGKTDAAGKLSLDFAPLETEAGTRNLTLEVTLVDDNGQWISERQTLTLHPEEFYIGLRPDLWFGREETEMGFDILTVNWDAEPHPNQNLYAAFQQVTWKEQADDGTYLPIFTPVSEVDFVTGADGVARLSFTPPRPGTYVLDVRGGNATSQIMIWVTGADKALYPNLPKQHLQLVADKENYLPGETAQIFIPNPLNTATQALITVERGTIRREEIISVAAGGTTYALPLGEDDAPTIYFSALLLDAADFRVGYAEINVSAASQILQVSLTSEPMRAEPNGEVRFGLRVTDWQGAPVQGEFSLAVVDLATLALADPNSEPIESAFYDSVGLGVQTSLSLAGDSRYGVFLEFGGGGMGGGEDLPSVRENFPDTAYWNAEIVTDANGEAQISILLPDNLTTWQVEVRGLTEDTRVGSAKIEIISTKDVLIRPVTPRFLVSGDHVQMAAVVHNNTAEEVSGEVTLQAVGFVLDDQTTVTQQVTVPAGGRTQVIWWGSAQDAEVAELLFKSEFGQYTDLARPAGGALPILRYTSPQSFVTAGRLDDARTLTESISLPHSFIPNGGKLEVTFEASLASVILEGLEALPVPDAAADNESTLSYLLPNLVTYKVLQQADLNDPNLEARLNASLETSLRRLLRNQNSDGGWGWFADSAENRSRKDQEIGGDPYLSAYILFGLWQAQETGYYIDETVFVDAREYLHNASLFYLAGAESARWQKDRLAFMQYVMQMTGGADAVAVDQLTLWQEDLSPWAQALLALTLESRTAGDARASDLIAELSASARRSASGAHWESDIASRQNPDTPNYTTAVVLYALAQFDPNLPLTDDALRYLGAHRTLHGIWNSTYENAWVLLAFTEVLQNNRDLNANYTFSAELNGASLAEGQADPLRPVTATAALDELQLSLPNALTLTRGEGDGSLYYRASLFVDRPAETAAALNQGFEISRNYYDAACREDCPPLDSTLLAANQSIKVQLTFNVSEDSYYLIVEDYIPAGTEILDRRLNTSRRGYETEQAGLYDAAHPFAEGWGWWLFSAPQIGAEKIRWTADYLPAGTYVLSYTLLPVQTGEYRVLPAHIWQNYFPEMQGTTAGKMFWIE
jgi:uncharacterized protein YfaS (alpha-2-macroglobulin family)